MIFMSQCIIIQSKTEQNKPKKKILKKKKSLKGNVPWIWDSKNCI